jgi:hypothetical protein
MTPSSSQTQESASALEPAGTSLVISLASDPSPSQPSVTTLIYDQTEPRDCADRDGTVIVSAMPLHTCRLHSHAFGPAVRCDKSKACDGVVRWSGRGGASWQRSGVEQPGHAGVCGDPLRSVGRAGSRSAGFARGRCKCSGDVPLRRTRHGRQLRAIGPLRTAGPCRSTSRSYPDHPPKSANRKPAPNDALSANCRLAQTAG